MKTSVSQLEFRVLICAFVFTRLTLAHIPVRNNTAASSVANDDFSIARDEASLPTSKVPDHVPNSGDSWCGIPAFSPRMDDLNRIVGGVEAIRHSWPWQCLILAVIGKGMAQQCGASVISSRFLLTAAHCLYYKDKYYFRLAPGSFIALCGTHNKLVREQNEQIMSVSRTIPHENYKPGNVEYDIALLELAEDLTFDDYVMPVCLPDAPVPDGTECTVTGWGRTQGGGSTSNELRQVTVPVIPQSQCYSFVTDSMVCAGVQAGGKDSCQGDSGGPLVCPLGGLWVLHGIVSFGIIECALPGLPSVYTRVDVFVSWIQRNAASPGLGPHGGVGAAQKNGAVDSRCMMTSSSRCLVANFLSALLLFVAS